MSIVIKVLKLLLIKDFIGDKCKHKKLNDPRYLNISMENIDFKPISLEEVRAIFESRSNEINRLREQQ